MEPTVMHWVVHRDTKTRVLMTFRSFADFGDADRHKAALEDLGDSEEQIIEITIESLPIRASPK